MSSDLRNPIDDVLRVLSQSEEETERLGTSIAAELKPGDVVALVGPLGAGKTRLVQAIAADLGVDRRDVSSPTFVLIQEYAGRPAEGAATRLPVYHFDAYRLRDLDEFLELGADEILQSGGICLIEWADRVVDALPVDLVRIEAVVAGPTSREFRLTGTGPRGRAIVAEIRQQPNA
jgi:tRNA threonylcarbamoyladenosine biosynthesis protein TsaE